MKLYLYDVDYNSEIFFEDGYVLSIECENREYFSQLVKNVKGINDNNLAIFEKDNLVSFEKDAVVIVDYFMLQNYEKSLFTKLYKLMEQINGNDDYVISKLKSIVKEFNDVSRYVVDSYNINLDINPPTNLSEYLKFFDLNFERDVKDVYQNLINFIDLLSILKVCKVLVLINAKSFFTQSQVQEIIKRSVYGNQKTLLIDNVYEKEKLNNEIKILIDNDLYDIMLK